MRADARHEQERAERRLHQRQAREELLRARKMQSRLAGGKRHRLDDTVPFSRFRGTRRD